MRVLVTSANGNQGRKLVPKLVARGISVRALDIAPQAEVALKAAGAIEVIVGDAVDPAILAQACAGVDAVYHIGPNAHPHEREIGFAVIDAAEKAGVPHIVYSSVLHPQITTLTQHRLKQEVEEHLVEAGVNFTILQPAHYMQTLQYAHAFQTGEFLLTWSLARRQSLIDVGDIADVAVKVLAEGAAHHGATYQLSGADCVTGFEIARILGEVMGQPVAAREVPPAEVILKMFPTTRGTPDFDRKVALFSVVSGWYSDHDFVGNPTVLTFLLGRAPTPFATFLAREYDAWKQTGRRA